MAHGVYRLRLKSKYVQCATTYVQCTTGLWPVQTCGFFVWRRTATDAADVCIHLYCPL